MNEPAREPLSAGPILIVADNEAIARAAPGWAKACATACRRHRVRLAGAGPSALAAVIAEARHLGAVAILWAGGHDAHAVAASAASHLGLTLHHEEVLDHAHLP